jgi:hypothetical protein
MRNIGAAFGGRVAAFAVSWWIKRRFYATADGLGRWMAQRLWVDEERLAKQLT